MTSRQSLQDWLEYIESTHPLNIDMGLTRIRKVFVCLQSLFADTSNTQRPLQEQSQATVNNKSQQAFSFDETCIVTVAGTNGKGTTCRFIEQACLQANYSVGVYASPHIERFNERIRVDGFEMDDNALCQAFEWVEQARLNASAASGEVSLSYFEYATLCAFAQFMFAKVKIWVIEVGLGGRLDATNLLDANIGVITSIGLDHQAYLGDTTEQIAGEKAGIIKQNQDVIIGYANPHSSVRNILEQHDAEAMICEQAFGQRINVLANTHHGWLTHKNVNTEFDLSHAQLPAQNIMTAIACLTRLAKFLGAQQSLLLPHDAIQKLIANITMPGRMQVLQKSPLMIVDVAHNQAAAEYLLGRLQQIKHKRCHIVIGMLRDKNIEATITSLAAINPIWYCVSLSEQVSGGRGETAKRLVNSIHANRQQADCFDNVGKGVQEAVKRAHMDDIILIVGSFIVASECSRFMRI